MKILLIDPPFYIFTGYIDRWFSPGLASIGAVLRQNGHEVIICQTDLIKKHFDVNFNSEYLQLKHYIDCLNNKDHWVWKEILEIIAQIKPDLVGLTALTMKFGSVVRVSQIIKEYNPQIPVIIGGPHASSWPKLSLSVDSIDYCLAGEAEDSIVEFISALESRDPNAMDKVPGLSFRSGSGLILKGPGPVPRNLDRLPLVSRDLLMFPRAYSAEDMGLLLTTRGCPYHCTFCSHERSVRFRSIDNVMHEISHVIETYGTRQFAFKDDSFSIKRKRTVEFCNRLIKEGFDINWEITTRVNLVDEELLDLMVRAGLNIMKIGVESGSERILKQIEKTTTMKQMRQVARLFNKNGLFWSGYFMYGLPDENEEDMKATYRFMRELNPMYAGLGLYAPMPDTPLWQQGVEMGLVISDDELSIEHFFTTNPKDYFFKDPEKRVQAVSPHRFKKLGKLLAAKFNRHNTNIFNLIRRAIARKKIYLDNPLLFIRDVNKGLKWAFPSWIEKSVETGRKHFHDLWKTEIS
ncbi:B12-binding domain-containing radical SAM protein [Candidatus Riflebacteria bacterium]